MIIRRKFLRGAALAAFLVAVAVSVAADGSVSGAFSEDDAGPRGIGMGNAFVAVADDAYAMVANPAGLANLDRASATFEFSNLYGLGLLRQSYLGAVFPTRYGVHGVSYRGLSIKFDPYPQKLSESTLNYSYGQYFGPVSLGLSMKYYDITSDFTLGTASGFGMDAGIHYQVTERGSIGASIQNLFSTLKYGTGTTEDIPASWRIGASYRITDKWLVAGEFDGVSGDPLSNIRFGTEYWIMRPYVARKRSASGNSIFESKENTTYPVAFAVRGGFDKSQSGVATLLPSIGSTMGYGSVHLDYAYVFPNKNPGGTHRTALTYDFKPWENPSKPTAEKPEAAPTSAQPAPAPAAAPLRRIAVLDFANATGDRNLSWLELGFADIVAKDLMRRGLAVVPRTQLTGTASLAGPEIMTIARTAGAAIVVRGVFVKSAPDRMLLTARLIDGGTGRTVEFVEAEGGTAEIFSIGATISEAISRRAEGLTR